MESDYAPEMADPGEGDLFGALEEACLRANARPRPTWKCEYCGQFYSERTGAKHAYCQQEQDRKDAEGRWG